MDFMTDMVVWLSRFALFAVLAWGATRFWKHTPAPLPTGAGFWARARAWRAHILYYGGWAVYLVYSLFLREGLSLHRAVPTLASAAIILGVIQFVTHPPKR